jgi:hypothetical protein
MDMDGRNIIVRGRGLPAVLVVLEYYGGVKWKGPSLDPPVQSSPSPVLFRHVRQ